MSQAPESSDETLHTSAEAAPVPVRARSGEREVWMKLLAWSALAIAFVALSWLGKTLENMLTPIVFAMFLCYLIVPLVGWFERYRLPRFVGYLLSLSIMTGAGIGVGAMMAASIDQFQANFPAYEQNLNNLVEALERGARWIGYLEPREELMVPDLLKIMPTGAVQDLVTGGVNTMIGWLTFLTVTLFFMVFMIFEAEKFTFRVTSSYPRGASARVMEVVRKFNHSIQRYMMLKVVVSVLTGLLSYFIMLYFELDFAGVLAFILFIANFIPYIGSIVATILPGVLALLQFPNWQTSLLIMAGITIVQQVMGNLVEPRLQGRGLNVSPLIILVFLAYFSWMWGIVGMIVSMPAAAGVRIVLEQFKATESLANMMRDI